MFFLNLAQILIIRLDLVYIGDPLFVYKSYKLEGADDSLPVKLAGKMNRRKMFQYCVTLS